MHIRLPKIFRVTSGNRRRRVLIVVSVLIALALVYRFFPELKQLMSSKQEIVLKEAKILKYRKVVDLGRTLGQKLDELNQHLDVLESRLLTGKTPSLAGVEVQEIVQKIASKSQLRLDRVRVLKPRELDKTDYLSIPVDFAFMPTVRKLKEVLYGIESSDTFLKVTELKVRYHRSLKWDVQCQLTVAGLMKKPETRKTGP